MPYPGIDPFFQYDSTENRDRMEFYSIGGSSHLYIDGIVDAGFYHGPWDSLFDMRYDVPSPLEITLSGSFDPISRNVDLDAVLTATDSIEWDDLHFHCVLIESRIHWPAPNGLQVHNEVMRDMVPDAEGQAFSISEGDTVIFERRLIVDTRLDADSCDIVMFVQSSGTRNILQAAIVSLSELHRVAVSDDAAGPPLPSRVNSCQPNPFNTSTTIRYSLSEESEATIGIYDIHGRRLETIRDGFRPPGEYGLMWDASALPSGIYFARLEGRPRSQGLKMILLK
jgi:hypothetical protein